MKPTAITEFRGTSRFRVAGRVGHGGVGVVYDAFDCERRSRVALKTLRSPSPETLLALKHEFRSVQDLEHPNLVHLGELFEEKGTWFFTMEFVEGTSFVRYVRPGDTRASDSSPPPPISQDFATPRSRGDDEGGKAFDEARLRAALAQLVRGLSVLHEAGKVHRDIKPSNVLVTEEGRVVILDFGVVRETARGAPRFEPNDEGMVGTVAYMAPEQALAEGQVDPAADWYAVGVVLYQSLTGRLPFEGTAHDVVDQKLCIEPPPPRTIVPGVPRDLDELCTELLRIVPRERPSARQILERLGMTAETLQTTPTSQQPVFVGRRPELDVLDEAYAEARRGAALTVLVRGESGVGKSFLVRRFVEGLRARDPSAVVLAGRCYERESVPYKAVDGVIDQLSAFLKGLPEAEHDALVGEDGALLARAFPVLGRARDETPAPRGSVIDPRELRTRVFAALRGLVARVAARAPLLVVIDDLQWADADSLALLAEVMRPPQPPPILLVATMRSGSDRRPELAHAMPGDVRPVLVQHLPEAEAHELATRLLEESPVLESDIRAIVREAKGHPLFIDELVRQRVHSHAKIPVVRLDDALWARVERLEPPARRLLELVCVAGVPITQAVAADAAVVDLGQELHLASVLRAGNLVRTGGMRKVDSIEPYHDRVRESVLAHLDETARAQWHGRLATALERAGDADPESLAIHWQGAGNAPRAAESAARAAEQAMTTLAFERAARLLRLTLTLGPGDPESTRAVRGRLAEALTNGGYVAEAAEVRLELARGAAPSEALELRRIAAEQLLCSGHFDRGLKLLRAVLREVRFYFPKSPLAVLVALAFARVLLFLRGLRFRERAPSESNAGALARVDAVWSAGTGFSMSDNIRGAYFQTRNLLLALDAGDPHRVARALAMEVCFTSAQGTASRRRTARLLVAQRALVGRLGTSESRAMLSTAEGWAHFMVGDWSAARAPLEHAEELFRDRCVGVAFQLNASRTILYRVLGYQGRLDELAARVPPVLREVEQRGDVHSLINLQTGPMALLALGAGDVALARARVTDAGRRLASGRFLIQHYYALLAQCQIDLYSGDAASAHARMIAAWPALRRSLLLRVQVVRIATLEHRCRAAISAALSAPGAIDAALLRAAEGDVHRLEREGLTWATAFASVMRGAIAAAAGRTSEAIASFDAASSLFDAEGMQLHAASTRRRAGELRGGEAGAACLRAADAWCAAQGVRDPSRSMATIIPGASR